MKAIHTFILITLILFLSNCGSKSCDITCMNGGTANENDCNCQCPTFYTGTNCETAINIAANGYYSGTRTCDGSTISETVLVTASTTSPSAFNISTVGNAAFLDENNFSLTEGQGSGTLNGNVLTINYLDYIQGSSMSNCTFTGTK